jgi:hypothetical protein
MNNAFNSTTAGTRPNSSLDSQIGVARYLHYDEAFGHIYLLDFILPFGMPRAVQASLSIGYAGIFGGEQRLDGSPTGVKTGEEQIRANHTQYITPTWQGSITLTHDMSASGQFKQDFSLILRVAKVF